VTINEGSAHEGSANEGSAAEGAPFAFLSEAISMSKAFGMGEFLF